MPRHPFAFAAAMLLVVAGCRSGAPVADPVVVLDAPPQDWAALDGRRVRIAAPLTVSGNHRLGEAREVVASFDGRLYAPTEVAMPGDDAARVAADNARRSVVLALPGTVAPGDWRGGSLVESVEGRVAAEGTRVRIEADVAPRVQAAARPAAPARAGDLRLAALNLENLFNGDGHGGGFPTARGASTLAGYERQRDRLAATLAALDADVVALMELENDGYGPASSLAQLVAALDPDGARWRFVDAGEGPGDNPIRVGLLYRGDRVTALGPPATLVEGPFADLSRAPLAQAFRSGGGPVFVVVANHFKSKGCRDAEGADRDQGDGQACWNPGRRASGERLRQWLASDPTGSGSEHVAIVGDLNAYAMEDPVREFIAAGWRDALAAAGPATTPPYSYVYGAQAGRLDHILLSPALADRLQATAVWHANADEAENVAEQAGNAAENGVTPWRSSDHDPVVADLRLRTP